MLRNAFENLATDSKLELIRALTESMDGKVATDTKLEAVRVLLNSLDTKQSQAYDPVDDMYKFKSMQKKFRDSFGGSVIDANKWETTLGTGGTATVSGGILTFGSGTTVNAVSKMLSKETFTIPFRVSFNLGLSQRIANASFYIEAISVDPTTLIPDGKHSCAMLFEGTVATTHKYSVQNNAVAPLVSGLVTFPTSAGSVSVYEMEPFCDEVWFHGKTLDATTGRANSYCRHQQIPDPAAIYKLQLRWVNGTSAPASNTNATLQFIACQDYAELTAEITAGRGQSAVGQGIGTYQTGGVATATQPVSGTVTITHPTPTAYILNSQATTNLVFIKATAGTLYSITATNVSASTRYVKIYNKASAPTLASDIPIMVITLLPGSSVNIPFGTTGMRLGTGIALAITGGVADTDTTAVVLGDVKLSVAYI